MTLAWVQSMNRETRSRVEAWLRFHDDLGLPPLLRDRAPASRAPAHEPPARNPSIKEEPPESPSVKAPATNNSLSRETAAWPAMPAPPAPPAAPSLLPVIQSPGLFDAADRVEGDTLERIREFIGECTRCRLHKQRSNIVFGVGNPKAELVFVGEGPGHDEDVQGIPFVGRAGKLLTQMIEAMGLRRDDVYICNVIKCRPPENRTPEKDEISTCSPFLLRQLDAIHPKVIVCLGSIAAQNLLGASQSISRSRGQWFDYRGARLMPTYHPAYLLRNPAAKGEVWDDLKKVMAYLGLQPRRALH